MAIIGPQLREARERRGLTAADAAGRLHMRAMFIDALEREDWRTVGEPVYVRGFIRNYGRMLGLDAQALVDAFNETVAPEIPQAGDDLIVEPRTNVRPRFRYPVLLGVMSTIAALLVIKVVWTMLTPTAVGHDEIKPPLAQAMVGQAAAVDHRPTATSANLKQGVDLRLVLTQTCWLSITVDGKRVVYQTLPAGTVKQFHGVREITMRAGNAGGVVANVDGQPLGKLGDPGQVQDRVFAVKMPPFGQNGPHE